VRPLLGTLTVSFANVAAYESFDPARPFDSRQLVHNLNRIWSAAQARRPETAPSCARARAAPGGGGGRPHPRHPLHQPGRAALLGLPAVRAQRRRGAGHRPAGGAPGDAAGPGLGHAAHPAWPHGTADGHHGVAMVAECGQHFKRSTGELLAGPPPGFVDDPYPVYAALRAHRPVHALAPGSWLLTRHEDVLAAYRSAGMSSDKQRRVRPAAGRRHADLRAPHHQPRVQRPAAAHAGAPHADGRAEPARHRAHGGGWRPWWTALLDACRAARTRPDRALRGQHPGRGDRQPAGHAAGRARAAARLVAGHPVGAGAGPTPEVLARANAAVDDFCTCLRGAGGRAAPPRRPRGRRADAADPGRRRGRAQRGELLHNCIFLLNAGHETTTNLIGNGVHALLAHRASGSAWSPSPR
jgi:hypothetical protein